MAKTNSKYYYELDILRGVACLLVLIVHIPIDKVPGLSVTKLFSGHIGVWLFFVISGFIITKTFGHNLVKINSFKTTDFFEALAKNRTEIYYFWYRRFIRLFPALSLLFLCSFVLVISYGIKHHDLFNNIIYFIRYICSFILLDSSIDYPRGFQFLDITKTTVTWTISCEILFYLVFPFMVVFKNLGQILSKAFIAILIIKAILTWFVPLDVMYFNQIANFDFFIAGILVALYHNKIKINYTVIKVLTIASLGVILLCDFNKVLSDYRYQLNIVFASTTLVYVAAIEKNVLNLPVIGPTLNFIGVRSYFIYLMHIPISYIITPQIYKVFAYLGPYFPKIQTLLNKNSMPLLCFINLLSILLILLLANLFYKFIEKPFIEKYKHKTFSG